MKLISANIFLICLLFACSACSLIQQTNSVSSSTKNNSVNSPSKTPRIADNTANVADRNLLQKWREQYDETLMELERNRKLWQESKIRNYDFVILKGGGGNTNGFNASATLIKIRNGEKSSMEAVEKDRAFNVESYNDFDTIDKLFDYLRQELDDRKLINIEYDKKIGYPKMNYITLSNSSHGGRFIEISKFEVIK